MLELNTPSNVKCHICKLEPELVTTANGPHYKCPKCKMSAPTVSDIPTETAWALMNLSIATLGDEIPNWVGVADLLLNAVWEYMEEVKNGGVTTTGGEAIALTTDQMIGAQVAIGVLVGRMNDKYRDSLQKAIDDTEDRRARLISGELLEYSQRISPDGESHETDVTIRFGNRNGLWIFSPQRNITVILEEE